MADDISVKTGFAFPVLEGRKVAAVMEFFTVKTTEPDESLLESVGVLATQLGRVTERKRAEDVIKRSEENIRLLLESTVEGIYGVDLDGNCTFANSSCVKILGYDDMNQLLGKNMHNLIHHTRKDGTPYPVEECRIYQAFREGKPTNVDDEVLWRVDGTSFPAEYRSHPIWQDDKVIGTVVTFTDITERKRVEEKLQFASKVFENTIEGIMVTDADGVIQFVNQAFTEITGYSAEEAIGAKPSILRSDKHVQAFYEEMWRRLIETGKWQGEIWNRRKSGEAYLERLTVTAIRDDKGKTTQFASVFYDITDIKRSEEEIRYQAFHDALTGLPNRSLFSDRLKKAIARARRRDDGMLAVFFIDLDDFKRVNDTMGHATGDLLLKGVAMRLVGCLREVDTVSRISGDEFMVILDDVLGENEAVATAGRIIEALAEPYLFKNEEFIVTVSVGIAVYPSDGDSAEALIRNADMAMYNVKERGKSDYQLFNQSMNEKVMARIQLENDLRKAIERDEIIVYYQPKVDITTGHIVGVEALARWRRADGSIIAPGEFIPLAEETGLIVPIGERVLLEACCHAKEWHDRGFSNLTVAVNLSARQLDQKNLLDVVKSTLDITELKPEYLCLELTESALMKDLEAALTILNKLKDLKVKISMDDFGTGYSSLSHLKKFPIYELKIDRSFVLNIPGDADSSAIAETIISMARILNLQVTAEGVETQTQLDFLRSIGCKAIQGFLFSPPVTRVEMEKLLMEKKILPCI